MCTAKKMKLIKRYANRRLYDADTSQTITLEDVAKMIQDGEEVRVIDNVNGEDITNRVLGQTFLKVSLEQQNLEFSSFLLTSLIKEVSTNVTGLLSRLVQGGIGMAGLTRERLEKIVQTMVEKGELAVGDRSDYLDTLLQQLSARKEQMNEAIEAGKSALKAGLGAVRSASVSPVTGVNADQAKNTDHPDHPGQIDENEIEGANIEELSARLDEVARLIRQIRK